MAHPIVGQKEPTPLYDLFEKFPEVPRTTILKMDLSQEIALKANLLQDGLRIGPAAMEGVGTRYKESENWQFTWEFGEVRREQTPAELKLPLGTWVQVRPNEESHYLVRREGDALVLEKRGKSLTTVQWAERPKFYSRKTSDGVEMWKIGQLRGDDGLCFGWTNFCLTWVDDNQCRYCNFNYTHKEDKGASVFSMQRAEQVGEVAAAAWEEGIAYHVLITSGSMPKDRDVEANITLLESIRRHTGLKRVPGCNAHPGAPLDLSNIERLHEAGATNAVFNLEVWDPHLFEYMCPGKARNVGREHWLKALEHAVPVFGRGHVYSFFVTGLEHKESLYEGAKYLTERGIVPGLVPWIPMVGSKLEGHRPPTGEWLLEVNETVLDIVATNIPEYLTVEAFQDFNSALCYRCVPLCLMFDCIRRRLGGLEREINMEKFIDSTLVTSRESKVAAGDRCEPCPKIR